MTQAATATMPTTGILVSDVSGQKQIRVKLLPKDTTIGDLIQRLLVRMGLATNDSAGRPLSYRARLDREGRHLDSGERVGDSLQEDDAISLHPNVDAGGCGRQLGT